MEWLGRSAAPIRDHARCGGFSNMFLRKPVLRITKICAIIIICTWRLRSQIHAHTSLSYIPFFSRKPLFFLLLPVVSPSTVETLINFEDQWLPDRLDSWGQRSDLFWWSHRSICGYIRNEKSDYMYYLFLATTRAPFLRPPIPCPIWRCSIPSRLHRFRWSCHVGWSFFCVKIFSW